MALRLSLLTLFSLLSLLTFTVDARPGHPFHPCNTLIISTYSFSLLRPQNPNHHHHHPDFIAVITDLRPDFLPRHPHHLSLSRHAFAEPLKPQSNNNNNNPEELPEFPLVGFSSFKDRTKDILSVVASLLFGAACGALTAGTMYLIWSLFNHRSGSYRSLDGFTSDDDDNDDDDDIFNPKKKGYVTIPAAPVKDSAVAVAVAVPVPAKETA